MLRCAFWTHTYMGVSTADDRLITWLHLSLVATEATFTPWQRMHQAICLLFIHMCTDMHVTWVTLLHSAAVLAASCTSARGNLISWSKSVLHCFSALPTHQFCLGGARRWNRCSRNDPFLFISRRELLLTHTHTKALINTPAWYMKNRRVCEVGLLPAQGWFILD